MPIKLLAIDNTIQQQTALNKCLLRLLTLSDVAHNGAVAFFSAKFYIIGYYFYGELYTVLCGVYGFKFK